MEVDLIADMTVINPFDFFLEPSAETFPFRYEDGLEIELEPFRAPVETGPNVRAFLNAVDRRERSTIDFPVDLNSQAASDSHIRWTRFRGRVIAGPPWRPG